MDELLVDASNFIKVEFNKKHKIKQEIQHVLNLEVPIKDRLGDLLKNEQIIKEDYNCLKPYGSRPGIMHGLCII